MFVTFLILIGAGALAVDLSATANRAQELQSAADAAALHGVTELERAYLDAIAVPGTTPAEAKAASEAVARAEALKMLAQNGIVEVPGEIVPVISFPGPPGDRGKMTVRIDDTTQNSVLSQLLGFTDSIGRDGTAEFLGCSACSVLLPIPAPPQPVQAQGNGDGFIPIPAGGDRLYAINHNSFDNEIVCINTELSEPCWYVNDNPSLPFEEARSAYLPGNFTESSPEMPHAAVVDDRIYWAASDSSGHNLFCFNTSTDSPCINKDLISTNQRGNRATMPNFHNFPTNDGRDKDEGRGGGTIGFLNKVYTFTDDHQVHCFEPLNGGGFCTGFTLPNGGSPTGLAVFPDNEPLDGNHGGSIDRVIDATTGYIYSTIHIPHAVDSHDCSVRSIETLADLVDQVVVLDGGGSYLSAIGTDNVVMTGDPTAASAQWRLTEVGGEYYFESVELAEMTLDPGTRVPSFSYEWLDGGYSAPSSLGTDFAKIEPDNAWTIAPTVLGFTIESIGAPGSFLNVSPTGDPIQEIAPPTTWNIQKCQDLARDAGYAAGTWVHCFNTGTVTNPLGPCPGFAPDAPLHVDASRFSGRLFFHHQAVVPGNVAPKTALCSTGFDAPYWHGAAHTVEVVCVDLVTGLVDPTLNMTALATEIDSVTSDAPGAWGVPHYNSYQNRLFYPSERRGQSVVCWDFNTSPSSSCDTITGRTVPDPVLGNITQDYGFVSRDNCVFGLGHFAYFWSFQADDVGEPCRGATAIAEVTKCECTGGASRGGLLDLEGIDTTDFDVFEIKLTRPPTIPGAPAEVIWPAVVPPTSPRDTWWSIIPGGRSRKIDLDAILNIPGNEYDEDIIELRFYIESQNPDIFLGPNAPHGEITFLQRPRLID